MKKTLLWLVLGSIAGFWLAWQSAERSVRLPLLPAHLELDGEPLSVDGVEVRTWQEVNEVLKARRKVSMSMSSNFSFYERVDGQWHRDRKKVEQSLDTFEITYLPRSGASSEGVRAPKVTRVRAWLPVTLDFARTRSGGDFVRYEVVMENDNE
jgi:hypothetical protein